MILVAQTATMGSLAIHSPSHQTVIDTHHLIHSPIIYPSYVKHRAEAGN